MANLSENRIDAVITEPDITEMTDSISNFIGRLPPNTSLTDDQRKAYQAINVANKVFTEDVLAEARIIGGNILPAFIDLDALERDLTVFKQLDDQENALLNALLRLRDAKRIAGHEAYGQATTIYGAIKMASDSGIPNAKAAYDKLKVRFDSQGGGGRNEDATE